MKRLLFLVCEVVLVASLLLLIGCDLGIDSLSPDKGISDIRA